MASSVPTDFAEHVARLRRLPQHEDASLRALFDRESPIHIARAPGRLDVMGGIADYSGSLVLELPIEEAAFAAVQTTVDPGVTIVSRPSDADTKPLVKKITSQDWAVLQCSDFNSARSFFNQDPYSSWAAYVAGPAIVLLRETSHSCAGGFRILIDSRVPEGKGVSSSAAIEVATTRAVATALGIDLPAEELARLCQVAENLVVGAPCGIMDQMTSAMGRANELLALRCQPATVEGFVPIPSEIAFWAIDSGVRHFVGGADYSSVRCGAFMGYRMIAEAAGFHSKISNNLPHRVEIDDPIWNGYLANLSPSEFHARFASVVLDQMPGREFLARYSGTTDRVTQVDPAIIYAVRAPTIHPIEESERVQKFRTLLQNPTTEHSLLEMGRLMFAAHASYTACGLGSTATDLLVDLVRESGPASGLYGAKITGGGSGGTVAILGHSDAESAVDAVTHRYRKATGSQTRVFRGSSPGAYSTPVQQIVI